MAWNPSPKIADLRELSSKWGCDQIVVLALKSGTGTFETVSYGQTKSLCDAADKIRGQIHAAVEFGIIGIVP